MIMKAKIIIFLLLMQPLMLFAQIIHSVSFKDIQITDSKINQDYLEIECDGLTNCNEQEGMPSLPSKSIHLYIPSGYQIASVAMINPVVKTIALTKKILPFQGKIPTNGMSDKEFVAPLQTVYNSDLLYPGEQIQSARVNYFDYTNQIASLKVTPFQYDAKNNRLMFYSSFDIQVTLTEKQIVKNNLSEFKRKRTAEHQAMYNTILSNLVDNRKDIEYEIVTDEYNSNVDLRSAPTVPPKYVVITSEALAPAFKRFVAWKKRKGIDISIVTMEYIRANYSGDLISGIYDDAGKLRQFLFDSYQNKLVYALLGGDKNTVPIRLGTSQDNTTYTWNYVIPTDLYFSDFNGNWNVDGDSFYGEPTDDSPDYAAEISVGRLLCSTSQHIENWTEKLIRYESNPGNGNFAYLKKAFYTQADQMQDKNQATAIKNTFTMFPANNTTIFEEIYNGVRDHNSAGLPEFPTGDDVINEFNKNYGFVSFMGHGSQCVVSVATVLHKQSCPIEVIQSPRSGHSACLIGGSVVGLSNYDYPNINYSMSCQTMPFDDLGSGMHSNHPDNLGKCFTILSKAGSVAYLGNTRNGYVADSHDLFKYFGQEINKGFFNLGVAEANSLFRITDIDIKYTHNLLGCPETEMWTDIPAQFTNATVVENGNSVTVNTGGVTGCTIALTSSADDGQSYFRVAHNVSSDTFTDVCVPVNITITKHNYIPYLDSAQACANFTNQIVSTNTTFTSCNDINAQNVTVTNGAKLTLNAAGNINVQNVNVINNSKLILDAVGEVNIIKDFEVELGSEFEIK